MKDGIIWYDMDQLVLCAGLNNVGGKCNNKIVSRRMMMLAEQGCARRLFLLPYWERTTTSVTLWATRGVACTVSSLNLTVCRWIFHWYFSQRFCCTSFSRRGCTHLNMSLQCARNKERPWMKRSQSEHCCRRSTSICVASVWLSSLVVVASRLVSVCAEKWWAKRRKMAFTPNRTRPRITTLLLTICAVPDVAFSQLASEGLSWSSSSLFPSFPPRTIAQQRRWPWSPTQRSRRNKRNCTPRCRRRSRAWIFPRPTSSWEKDTSTRRSSGCPKTRTWAPTIAPPNCSATPWPPCTMPRTMCPTRTLPSRVRGSTATCGCPTSPSAIGSTFIVTLKTRRRSSFSRRTTWAANCPSSWPSSEIPCTCWMSRPIGSTWTAPTFRSSILCTSCATSTWKITISNPPTDCRKISKSWPIWWNSRRPTISCTDVWTMVFSRLCRN